MKDTCLSVGNLFLALLLLSSAAQAEDEGREVRMPEADRKVSFEDDVLPVLQKNCLACHNKSETEGELVMESVESLMEGGDSGPAVVPGKADDSLLFQLAAHQTEPIMPPVDNDVGAKPLSPIGLGLIKQWIDQGAKAGESKAAEEITWKKIPQSYAQIFALELSPDGRWLAAGRGNELVVYSVTAKQQVARLADEQIEETHPDCAHLDVVQSLAWSPDAQTLVSGGFRCIKVWKRRDPAIDSWEPTDEDKKLLGDEYKDAESFVLNEDKSRLVVLTKQEGKRSVKLVELPSRKVLKEITSDIFSQPKLATAQRVVGLAKERSRIAQADVNLAKKRKEDDEKNTKKNEDDLKKAKEQVPKRKETFDKTAEAKTKKQAEVDKARAEVEKLKQELADAPKDQKKAKQNALKNAENQLKNRTNELKKATDEEKKKRLEFEGAEKVVKLGVEAVERAKKAVMLRTEELAAAEAEAKTYTERAKDAESKLAKTKEHANSEDGRAELSSVRRLEGGWQFGLVDAKSDKMACLNFAGGELVSIGEPNSNPSEAADEPAMWELVRTIGSSSEEVFADRVTSLAFSHDGSILAVGGGEPSRTGEVHLWDTAEWKQRGSLSELHSDVVYDLQFSPQDDTLASCGSDRMMKTIDPTAAKLIRNFEGHTGHVLGVAWRADGRTLATAGSDKVLKVWDAKEGTQKKTVSGFKSEITGVRFLGLEDRFVFSTGRGKVESRDSNGGGKPGFGGFSDYVHKVSSDQAGKVVAAAGQDQVIRVWDAAGKLLVDFKP